MRTRKKFMAVGESCMAKHWPTTGFEITPERFSTEGTIISAPASPLLQERRDVLHVIKQGDLQRHKTKEKHLLEINCTSCVLLGVLLFSEADLGWRTRLSPWFQSEPIQAMQTKDYNCELLSQRGEVAGEIMNIAWRGHFVKDYFICMLLRVCRHIPAAHSPFWHINEF